MNARGRIQCVRLRRGGNRSSVYQPLCCAQRITHQHRDRHRPYAARDGSDEAGALPGRVEMDVATHSVRSPVDSNVDHDCARSQPFAANQLGLAHCGNQHVGTGNLGRKIERELVAQALLD